MRQRLIIWIGIILLLATTLACNAFAGRPGSTLPPPPAVSPTSLIEEPESGGPSIAATVTLPGSMTLPDELSQVRILVDLNIRSGPGVQFSRAGFLLRGETVPVIGRDEDSGWWQIACPPATDSAECWVSGESQYTRLEEAPATPSP